MAPWGLPSEWPEAAACIGDGACNPPPVPFIFRLFKGIKRGTDKRTTQSGDHTRELALLPSGLCTNDLVSVAAVARRAEPPGLAAAARGSHPWSSPQGAGQVTELIAHSSHRRLLKEIYFYCSSSCPSTVQKQKTRKQTQQPPPSHRASSLQSELLHGSPQLSSVLPGSKRLGDKAQRVSRGASPACL